MSIGRFGEKVVIGFSHCEIAWIEAALTLPRLERARAFSDIADMGGRTFASVQRQANVVAAKAREAERQRRMVALVPMVIRAHAPVALPSTLNTGAAFLARRTGSRA